MRDPGRPQAPGTGWAAKFYEKAGSQGVDSAESLRARRSQPHPAFLTSCCQPKGKAVGHLSYRPGRSQLRGGSAPAALGSPAYEIPWWGLLLLGVDAAKPHEPCQTVPPAGDPLKLVEKAGGLQPAVQRDRPLAQGRGFRKQVERHDPDWLDRPEIQ